MTRIHRAALTALVLVLAFVLIPGGPLFAAGEGRVVGTVADGQNQPVQGAKILLTLPGVASFKQEKTTDKAGKFTLLILDATKEYKIRIEKDGFQPFEEALKPKLEDTMRITYTLAPTQEAAADAGGADAKELEGKNAAVAAYNEGVGKLKADDKAGATAKFEEALKLNPDLVEAQAVLADLYVDQKKYPEAVASAERVLQAKPNDPGALAALYDGAIGMGDTAKAQATMDALAQYAPGRETAVRILNKGVADFNANRMPEAIAAFELAEKADPTLPKTQYMLGLAYVNADKKDEARQHLAKYLEMEPNGDDAATAKAILDELKK